MRKLLWVIPCIVVLCGGWVYVQGYIDVSVRNQTEWQKGLYGYIEIVHEDFWPIVNHVKRFKTVSDTVFPPQSEWIRVHIDYHRNGEFVSGLLIAHKNGTWRLFQEKDRSVFYPEHLGYNPNESLGYGYKEEK